MVESPAVLGTGACLNVAYGATMPKIIEKGTLMSQVMIVVEFEVKPEHRSQFIDLMRGHAERSRRDDGCLQFDLMLPKDEAIAAAGVMVQIDCPDLAMGRHIQYAGLSVEEFRKRARLHVEALNHAVANIPAEQLRMHVCWGNYEGP